MNLPVAPGFMDVLSAGPSVPMYCLEGAIGTSFLTPEQDAWNDGRKRYGTLDDPDAGGYQLAQIDWDKDNGTAEMSMLEATDSGWYAASPGVKCECHNSGPCGCR
jgi:hypothetical protein